jgi:hypothetical protein
MKLINQIKHKLLRNIPLFLITILCVLMPGCGGTIPVPPTVPTQGIMVSTQDPPTSSGGTVETVAFLPNVPVVQGNVEGEGGRINEGARPATAPGISANSDIYVVAYWGSAPGFNNLLFFVSETGRLWNRAGSDLIAGASEIDNDSRISLTFFEPTQTWFVAFRDTSDLIQIAQYRIGCLRAPTGDCRQESRVITAYTVGRIGNVVNTGLTTDRAPTLSFVGNNLVLAFVPPGTNAVSIATSPDGNTFTAPRGTGVLCDAGAPYLNNMLGLYMATAEVRTDIRGSSAVHIKILTSTDGLTWRTVRIIDSGANPATGTVNPAIAGPESDMLVAYRTEGQSATSVRRNGGSGQPSVIQTNTNGSFSLTWGP